MNWLKDLIENKLDDNARVILFGLGGGAVERVREKITSDYKGLGGSENYTDRDLEEKLKDIQRGMLPQMGVALGAFSIQLKLAEEFKFSTVPGIQAAARTIDGYGAVIGNILQTKESLLYGYGMTAKNIFQGAAGAAIMSGPVIRALMRLPAQIRMLRQAKNILTGIRAIRTASVATSATNWVSLLSAVASTAVIHFGGEAAAKAAQMALEEHATRQAIKAHAPELMVPTRITDDFENYRSTFMRHNPNNAYATMEGMLTERFMGVSADMFGYDYHRASGITKKMSMSGVMPESQQGAYAMRAMQLDGMFGSGTMFEGTMADMSRITMGGDVDEATELFQEFFSSLVVDGRLHVAQLALVGEMSGFTESYVMGKMFNLEDGASNLARTHQFLNPIFGNRQTTAATQQMVTGLDSVIQQGAFGENIHVSNIMARTGITRGEAAHGITSNPETLEKFLYGMYLQMGIGHQSFDENGDLNDADMQRFMAYTQHGLNMDSSTSRGMYAAYREYVRGARGEEVSTAYAENVIQTAGAGSEEMGLIQLTQGWIKGTRVLSEITFSYADVLIESHRAISSLGRAVMPAAMSDIVASLKQAESVMGKEDVGVVEIIKRAFSSLFSPDYSGSGGRAGTSGGVASVGGVSVGAAMLSTGDFDPRFNLLSEDAKNYQMGMLSALAGGRAFRISGMGGFDYNSSDPRLVGKTNVGTDVVIGDRGSTSPIYFPFVEGTVMYVGGRKNSRGVNVYGLSVVIDLDGIHQVSFSHLSSVSVTLGRRLSRGDLIGHQGTTGLATGAHVDIEYRRNGVVVDNVMGGTIVSNPEQVADLFTKFLPSEPETPPTPPNRENDDTSSQMVPEYVNIDIELAGQNTSDFARHFENSFMRA